MIQKLGSVDYVVSTPNRRKNNRICHVNLMKKYEHRDFSVLCSDVLKTVDLKCCDTETMKFEVNCTDFDERVNRVNFVESVNSCKSLMKDEVM